MGRKTIGLLVFFLILLIAVGGFFCWQKSKNESKSPTLFDKEDYKIVEKNGEKFIKNLLSHPCRQQGSESYKMSVFQGVKV